MEWSINRSVCSSSNLIQNVKILLACIECALSTFFEMKNGTINFKGNILA